MSKFKNVMLDIETLGNRPYSVIISIGAIEFDPATGKTGKEFYVKVNPESGEKYGLKMQASTVLWWMAQNEEARKEFTEKKEKMLDLPVALKLFADFLKKCNKDVNIWANSPSFDCARIREAYYTAGYNDKEIPWTYRQECDYRTIVKFCKDKMPRNNVQIEHNALDDCKYQIDRLRYAFHHIGLTI